MFPKKATVVAAKKKPLPFVLTGTAVDDDESTAFLRTRNGQLKIAGIGETVESAKIVEIEKDSIVVEFNGDRQTLKIEPKGGGR